MVEPVVASDGHSYEHSAIRDVISRGNGLSPLTREVLTPGVLIPNRNLKKRIREHDDEVLQMAETARAALAAEYAERAEQGQAAGAAAPDGDEEGEEGRPRRRARRS